MFTLVLKSTPNYTPRKHPVYDTYWVSELSPITLAVTVGVNVYYSNLPLKCAL